MDIRMIICIIAGPVFLLALGANIYIKLKFKIGPDSDFDDYYHEFEDSHPQLAQQKKWSQISFPIAPISAPLLFIAEAL